ncbi:MAG TPA: beta-galactosidase [Prolixibacteraceae bacterium]|nr:beta-galactosidase [Prolixibacteraceae bacterium]
MKRLLLFLLLIAPCLGLFGQNECPFLPDQKLITPGVFYYPEHWPGSQWDRDFRNMASMGFEYVHMGEFAWAFLEPEEGIYDFEWLDKAISHAAKHGLKVMLCTPTATTPVWIGIRYPETYLVDAHYRRGEHGSRQNNSLADPKFRELAGKMTEALARRYGRHPAVWGWQLDNEPEAKEDYSPSSQEGFRRWLADRYRTIDRLNEAWGTAFWSLHYNEFDEISIHNTASIVWWGNNPHALLDFKRYTAWVQAGFLDEQAALLRKHIDPRQFITTNYAGLPGNADPRLTRNIDFPSFTAYPNGGSSNLGEMGFRLGNPDPLMLCNDYYRPMKGCYGILEIQPGQVNWGSPNPLLLPGTLRMWLWHCVGAGAKLASSYRYRQVLYGVEQYHGGIVENDGITPSQGGKDYMQFIREVNEIEKYTDPQALLPPDYAKKACALLFSHENMWDQNRQPQRREWNLLSFAMKYQRIMKSFGAPVGYISENDDFSEYPLLIVPAYQSVDEVLIEKWRKYAENGGDLVITCRTGVKNRDGHFWEGDWAEPMEELIGAEIAAYDMLPESARGQIDLGGRLYSWHTWADILNVFHDDEMTGQYRNTFYDGAGAVVTRKIGKGSVTYIGAETEKNQMEKDLLRTLLQNRGVPVPEYPEGLFTYWRNGIRIAVNYASTAFSFPLPDNAVILLGEKIIEPAGVLIWKDSDKFQKK